MGSKAGLLVLCLLLMGLGASLAPVMFGESVFFAVPLVFVGLAFAIPVQVGLFNIGGEGQILAGGLVAALLAVLLPDLPPYVLIPICCCGAFFAGAGLAVAAWLLRYRYDLHEVVSTLLMNLAIAPLTVFVARTTIPAEGTYQGRSATISSNGQLPAIDWVAVDWIVEGSVNAWFLAAALLLVACSIVQRSQIGLAARAVGLRPAAARLVGYNDEAFRAVAMGLGGGVAGLGSIGFVLGHDHAFVNNFSSGLGYSGIVVALLFGRSVWGVVLAALFLGWLNHLFVTLQFAWGISKEVMHLWQAILILIALGFQRDEEPLSWILERLVGRCRPLLTRFRLR